jgi:hypothetical protein
MNRNLLLSILTLIITIPLYSQDWIGIGSGTTHMEIKDSIIRIYKGYGYGEHECKAIDPDTGEDKYGVIIEIFDDGDSIKYKSLNGKIYNTFYRGNKYKRAYPFRFYSICLETYDSYNIVNRFEVTKHREWSKTTHGKFEYNHYNNNTRLEKKIKSEIIDSFDIYSQYLDIENMSEYSFPLNTDSGHGYDFSLTITSSGYIKYQYIGVDIPYHFRPIANLLRKIKDEK